MCSVYNVYNLQYITWIVTIMNINVFIIVKTMIKFLYSYLLKKLSRKQE